ncbi:DUF2304 family protein [Candidatus Uhrbacteria bacterium]|nr:DUF2304 family protein [Candidatus Uhrbacteria bacterium]
MIIIQFIIIAFAFFAVSRTLLKFREGKVPLGWLIFWLLFWGGVGTVALLPEVTSLLARLVGITRGVDLAVYLSIILLFYLVSRILIKIESLEQEITKVVRQSALEELEKRKEKREKS